MAFFKERYVVLTQTPYGGVRSPIHTFATRKSAWTWGYRVIKGVNWIVVPTIVFTTGTTFALLTSAEFGGDDSHCHTYHHPLLALRRAQQLGVDCEPRAIAIISREPPLPSKIMEPPPHYFRVLSEGISTRLPELSAQQRADLEVTVAETLNSLEDLFFQPDEVRPTSAQHMKKKKKKSRTAGRSCV